VLTTRPLGAHYTNKRFGRTRDRATRRWVTAFRLLAALIPGLLAGATAHAAFPPDLFGYVQSEQQDTDLFSQWIQVLERHLLLDLGDGDCNPGAINRCHINDWLAFLAGLKGRPLSEQLAAVNRYANHKRYVLDIDNYGVEDYWAVAREFLNNNGDCEDYAITKLFSLRWLGLPSEQVRIVVLQDTNLRIPHAVLAVADDDDILVLDNQIEQVISHRSIVHYSPVYSINENNWWIHLPHE
jgi:predicted transglutaminase-like cysteine proteinase